MVGRPQRLIRGLTNYRTDPHSHTSYHTAASQPARQPGKTINHAKPPPRKPHHNSNPTHALDTYHPQIFTPPPQVTQPQSPHQHHHSDSLTQRYSPTISQPISQALRVRNITHLILPQTPPTTTTLPYNKPSSSPHNHPPPPPPSISNSP